MKSQFTFTKLFLAGLLVLGFAMPVMADQNPQATQSNEPVYVDWWDEFLDGPDSTVGMTDDAKAKETMTSGSVSHNSGSTVMAMDAKGQDDRGLSQSGYGKDGKVQIKYDSSWMIDEDW